MAHHRREAPPPPEGTEPPAGRQGARASDAWRRGDGCAASARPRWARAKFAAVTASMPTAASTASPVLTMAVGIATLLAVAFGRVPGVSLSRAVLALAGATALVLTGALTLDRALAHVDGEVLVLLFGLMAVNAALAEAGAFRLVTALVTRGVLGPRRLLGVLVVSAGVLSALFLNDTVAIMLTPLVIRAARRLGLPPVPYLLGLALAANAGSVATVTGNPQNVLVAVAAD